MDYDEIAVDTAIAEVEKAIEQGDYLQTPMRDRLRLAALASGERGAREAAEKERPPEEVRSAEAFRLPEGG